MPLTAFTVEPPTIRLHLSYARLCLLLKEVTMPEKTREKTS